MTGPRHRSRLTSYTEPARSASVEHVHRRDAGGIDVGWLVACGGLVVVAVLLGRPSGPSRSARECRTLLAGIVRPGHT